jgi:hypothetical protein
MIDQFNRDYLRLVLEIHAHHIDGFVDAYYGPKEIQAEVNATEPLKPVELLAAVQELQSRIPSDDPARQAYLTVVLRGLECTVRMLLGESYDYLDEVQLIYDIRPELIAESRFEAAHRVLDQLLPSVTQGESLADRLDKWRKGWEIDTNKALPILELARQETRRRTAALVALPDDESVEIKLVNGQPWSAYNWYLGNGSSLIEFNTDLPLFAPGLIGTFAHEGYPGHHTEHMLKEDALYRQKGYAEQAAMLLHSPSAVIAEGIATTALEMIFPDGDHNDWNLEVAFPAAGLSAGSETADHLRQIGDAAKSLRYVNGNAAILYHTSRLSREQTIDYLQTFGLTTPERAAKSFSFLSHPLFRSYVFTYSVGYDLIAATPDPAKTFLRLLTEQVLPSQLISSANSQGI